MSSESLPRDNQNTGSQSEALRSPVRRSLLLSGVLASLVASYGTLTGFAFRFIFPERSRRRPQRIFVGFARDIGVGQSRSLTLPSGDQLIVSNTGRIKSETGITYIGFSSRCPHLGCRVHWEQQQERFRCPCHQGIFSSDGVATAGPPAQAGQKLRPYPLELQGSAMYVLVEEA